MAGKSRISPDLLALSSNGDSSSDDDVFLNSRLDVMAGNYDQFNQQQIAQNPNLYLQSILGYKMDKQSPSPVFCPSPRREQNAVIFSIIFCGKNFGEVGLFEPDISILNWPGFKSYLFSSLNLELSDSFLICYCDEEGDKIPIETEEEYQEALKIAKQKASEEDKFYIYITRLGGGGFPSSLRSLVSSSLRRVNSVGSSKSSSVNQTIKKDVTTSTSFQNLGKEATSDSFDFCGENKAITYFIPFETQVSFSEEQDMADRLILQECALPHSAVVKFEPTSETTGTMQKCYLPPGSVVKIGDSSETAPLWFADYMKQFKEDLCQDVYSKIEEMFEFSVGHLRTTEVEKSVKSLLTVYSSELQNKVLCCCKTSSGECSKDTCEKRSQGNVEKSENYQRYEAASYAEEERNLDMHSKIDPPPGTQNQDYFLQKLLKREQEILDFLDSTNEKIKQKIEINNDFNNSWRNCNGNDLGIEERERVLNRIEDFRQRQSRTADEIGRLHAAVTQKEDGCDIFKSSFLFPYNAKFIEDKTYKDGDTAEVGQMVTKTWVVQNIGTLPWDEKTFLRCINKEPIRPNSLVQCPPLSPGKIGTVSVSFMAPQFNGDYHIQWRFQQDNTLFGDHLWCYLKVVNNRHNVDERIERIIRDSVSPCPSNTFVLSNYQQPELLLTTADPESRLVDTSAANFNENIRLYSDMNELFVSSMETDQLLNFLLYVLNVTNKDLPTMRDSEPYKILRDLVVDGNQPKHFQRLVEYLDLEVRSNRTEIRHTLNNTVRGFCDLVFSKKTEENLVEENVNLNFVCSKDDDVAQIEKVETGEGRNLDSSSLVEIACLCDASCHKFIQELKIKFAEEATRCTVCRRNNSSGLCLHSKSERNKENWDVGDKEEYHGEYDEECESECADEEGEGEGEYGEEAEEYEHERNSAEKENEFERKQDSTCVSEAYSELFNHVNISEECPILKRKLISKPFEIPHLAYSGKIYKEENIEMCAPKSMEVEAEVDHPQECEGEDYLTHKCEREEVQAQGCEGRNEAQNFIEEEEDQGQESDEEEDQEQDWGEGQAQYSEEEEQAQDCEGEEYQVQECEEDLVQDCEEVNQAQDSEGEEYQGKNFESGQVQYWEEGWVQEGEVEEDQVLEGEECKIEEHQTQNKDGGVDQLQNVEEKLCQPQYGEEESDFEKISVGEDFVPEKVECGEEVSQVCSEDSDESDDSDCSDYSPTDSEYSESEEESEIEDESGNRSLDYFPGITSNMIPLAQAGKKVGNRELKREDFAAAAVINETKVKKDITSLHENFNQNVEVNLDFEVISQRPIQASSHVTTTMSPATADPLTFQEKHFNVSSRPPPNQIKVPDSDEESFDGLVFVRHSDIPSSAPATEPCSPSTEGVQLFRDDPLHESDLSQSCSSFSEFEADEDGEPVDGSISEGVPVAGGNTVEDSSLPQCTNFY